MRLEIYLEGLDTPIFHYCASQEGRPDVVRLGGGQLFRFYRFREPKAGGNIAATYRPATVAEFPAMFLQRK
jgi:hypothetical protein